IETNRIYLYITSPTPSQNFANSQIQVTGTIDYAQGLSNVVMKIRVNGGAWQPVTVNAEWIAYITLIEGANLIEVNASDEINHVYADASVTVYYTSVAGVIYLTINSPHPSQSVNVPQIQVSGTIEYSEGLSNVSIKIRVNGGLWQSINVNQQWSTFVTLIEGANLIEVNASDEVKHVYANTSVTVTYTLEQTLKQFSVIVDVEKDTIHAGGTINITISVKDYATNAPVAGAYVHFAEWNNHGSFSITDAQTNSQGSVSCRYTAPNTKTELKVHITANVSKTGFENRVVTSMVNVKPIVIDDDNENNFGFLLPVLAIIILLIVIVIIAILILKRKSKDITQTTQPHTQIEAQQVQPQQTHTQIQSTQVQSPQTQVQPTETQAMAQSTTQAVGVRDKLGDIPQHLKERTMSLKRALSACETIGIDVSESRKSYNELTDLLDARKYEELLKRAEIDLQVALKKTVPQFIKSTEEDIAEYQKEGRDVTKARTASKALENKFAEGDYWGVIEKLVILDRAMNALAMESVEAKKEKGSVPISQSSKSATATAVIRCAICFGHVKPGLAVRICGCGKKFHETCAVRVGECPSCHTKFENAKTENA
ncbi:MAG: hypothetical protein QXT63_00430, partial [Thermoplasmata archaeon]